jgi:hypothetical protein
MRKRTDCRESLCTTLFRFPFFRCWGLTNNEPAFWDGGFLFPCTFFLRLSRLEFWFDCIESWVVARSFRYSFCLFFFLFSLLEKKLHHRSVFVCIYQPKKTSSLILILDLGLTLQSWWICGDPADRLVGFRVDSIESSSLGSFESI